MSTNAIQQSKDQMKTLQKFCLGLLLLSATLSFAENEHGLTTVFFQSSFQHAPFTGQPFDQRITPVLDCMWGRAFDDKKIEDTWPGLIYSNALFIRWVGFVQADKPGKYTFRLATYTGGRLMIDGKMLVNALNDRSSHNREATIEMNAGEKKGILVEWRNYWAGGAVRLMWKVPGMEEFQIVPQSAFAPLPKDEVHVKAAVPKIETRSGFINERLYAVVTPPEGTYVNYTLDGSEPTRLHGTLYTVPVAITKSATMKARAFLPGGGQGDVLAQAFTVKETPLKDGLRIFRTGNSLTGNALVFLKDLEEAAGIRQMSHGVTGAGCTTKMLWEMRPSGVPKDNTQYDRQVIPDRANQIIKDNAPFDDYIVQPFFMSPKLTIEQEIEYAGKFYDLVLTNSPKTSLMLYAQFVTWELPNDLRNQPVKVLTTEKWRENMKNLIATYEKLRAQLQAKYPDRPVRIIPCASALLALEQAMEDGKIPGMKDYPVEIHCDNIHLGFKGCYMLGLVHYACLYGKSPVGLVVPDTDLTIEQQTKMQEIAWEIVGKYPWAGIAK